MNRQRRRITFLALGGMLLGLAGAQAQEDTVKLSVQSLLQLQGVDTALVNDTAAFRLRLENLKEDYPQRMEQCHNYAAQLGQAREALLKSGQLKEGVMWIDSTTCYTDFGRFEPLLASCVEIAQEMERHYNALEQRRIEDERKAAEERARQLAKQRQDSLDAAWRQSVDRVTDLHNQIESICLSTNVPDKKKQKALSVILYDYRAIFYRYDLTAEQGSEDQVASLEHLERFQRHLVDSVLGPAGYPNQIDAFASELKGRAGKSHSEVVKSYNKAFKTVVIPKSFGRLEDYRSYVARLRDVREVQQGYLQAIVLRETVSANSENLRTRCGKKNRHLYDAYETALSTLNQVPAFTTVGEKEMFFESMEQFILVQEQYLVSLGRLEVIDQRNDSILSLCTKRTSDVASSYKALMQSVKESHVPNYRTIAGADYFHQVLDDYELLQQAYIETIGLRNTILQKGDTIQNTKGAPKLLTAGFKEHIGRMVLVPSFANQEQAESYLQMLRELIETQELYLRSERLEQQMAANTATLKGYSKGAPHMLKAYQRLLKEMDKPGAIHSVADLTKYIAYQQSVLTLQARVADLMASPEQGVYNQRLKGVKDSMEIKGILGIYN